jgi:hypothetical protein
VEIESDRRRSSEALRGLQRRAQRDVGAHPHPALFLDGIGIPAPYQLRDLIAFTLLIMVLIFRPYGIMGERMARKRA